MWTTISTLMLPTPVNGMLDELPSKVNPSEVMYLVHYMMVSGVITFPTMTDTVPNVISVLPHI